MQVGVEGVCVLMVIALQLPSARCMHAHTHPAPSQRHPSTACGAAQEPVRMMC